MNADYAVLLAMLAILDLGVYYYARQRRMTREKELRLRRCLELVVRGEKPAEAAVPQERLWSRAG